MKKVKTPGLVIFLGATNIIFGICLVLQGFSGLFRFNKAIIESISIIIRAHHGYAVVLILLLMIIGGAVSIFIGFALLKGQEWTRALYLIATILSLILIFSGYRRSVIIYYFASFIVNGVFTYLLYYNDKILDFFQAQS
ncbi:MAG: hypothetical protein JXK07_16225 [Spirochaetes bacterium]|nr:hypothetical protein [Spirochaetota bacterium]MBN2772070.1 hypothetical protein [Spirochaetota bacterium]